MPRLLTRPIKSETIMTQMQELVFLKLSMYSQGCTFLDRETGGGRLGQAGWWWESSQTAAFNNDLTVQEEQDMQRHSGREMLVRMP